MTSPAPKPDATAKAEKFLNQKGIAFERRPDGSLFVPGDVVLDNRRGWKFQKLPDLSMVDVAGSFVCSHNELTTLEGAPRSVGGDFFCDWNLLTSLRGAPRNVGGRFICDTNRLTTLKHAPRTVGG